MTRMITRREFVAGMAATGITAIGGGHAVAAARRKLPVAAVVTEYRTNSHADVIVGKVLEGWQQDGKSGPDLELVSMFTDQVPKGDLSRGLSQKHGFSIVKTIEQAILERAGRLVVGVAVPGREPRRASRAPGPPPEAPAH